MQAFRVITFASIGFFLAFGIFHITQSGYLVPWFKLTAPSENVQEYFKKEDNHQNPLGSLIITNPCDLSKPEFSIISTAPNKFTKCVQLTTLYPEGESRVSYVLDENGNVWEWSKLTYIDLGELAGLLLIGILIGVWIAFYTNKPKQDNTVSSA